MTGRCIAKSLGQTQKQEMGVSSELGYTYNLIEGKTYLVVGITFVSRSAAFGTTVLFDIIDEADFLMPIPACLFEIVDPQCSEQWIGQDRGSGAFALWPVPFFEQYFHDRLSEREPEAVAIFHRVVDLMVHESKGIRADSQTPRMPN